MREGGAIESSVAGVAGVPGLAYASAYGVLGAIAGLAFGVVLTVIATGVIRAAGPKHTTERPRGA